MSLQGCPVRQRVDPDLLGEVCVSVHDLLQDAVSQRTWRVYAHIQCSRIVSGGGKVRRGEQADGAAAPVRAATSALPAWGDEAGLVGRFDILCFEVCLDAFLGALSAKA